MSNVFKYCDAQGVNILNDLELKITPPNQFNDPFEFAPHVICSAPRRLARNTVRDKVAIHEIYLAEKNAGHFKGSEREFRRLWKERRSDILPSLEADIAQLAMDSQKSFANTHSQWIAVLCVSSNPDSIVMWGHYSDKHRGIVVELNDSLFPFEKDKELRPVEYVKARPVWDYTSNMKSDSAQVQRDSIIFHKNEEWAYEKEKRALFVLEGLRRRTMKDGNTGYFLPVPAKAIVSVRLGTRCVSNTAAAVREAVKNPLLSHVEVKQASLHQSEFSMTAI